MKLLVLRNNLVETLSVVERGAGASASHLPILRNVLIRAHEGLVSFSTTNLELAVQSTISGKIIAAGEACVPLAVMSSIVKNLNAERVSLEWAGKTLTVTTDNYEAVVHGSDPKEFPIIPEVHDTAHALSFQTETFREALEATIVATQYSEIRPEISGVFITYADKKLGFVATDSFRLAEWLFPTSSFSSSFDSLSAIIPLRTAEELLRVFTSATEQLTLYFDQNQILASTPTRRVVSRLIDGKFPEYQAIIPRAFTTETSFDRQEFLSAVRLVSSFSGRANDITVAVGEGKKFLELSAADAALGTSRYRVPARVKGDGFSIVFNWRYLLDGLKIATASEVGLHASSNGPVLLKSETASPLLYLVMPIKS